jgi:hypothetical protein
VSAATQTVAGTRAATPTSSKPKRLSWPAWEYAILTALGVKSTQPNYEEKLYALNRWAEYEGMLAYGASSGNNWFAVSNPGWPDNPTFPGGVRCVAQCGGHSPIVLYDTQAHGVSAIVSNLLNEGSYGDIVTALRSPTATAGDIVSAISASPWGSHPTLGSGTVPIYGGGSDPGNAIRNPGKSETFKPGTQYKVGVGCSGNGDVDAIGGIVIPHTSTRVFTNCQVKGLIGGLLVGAGGLLMLTSAALVVSAGIGAARIPVPQPAQLAANAIRRRSPAPSPAPAAAAAREVVEPPRAREDRAWREMQARGTARTSANLRSHRNRAPARP